MYLKHVFINKNVNDLIQEHADQGSPNEIGGFLLGRPCISNGDHYAWIIKFVPGDCISSRTHVVIKESTFDRVWNELDNSELIIMGWYHTHPGLGIFLSQTDIKNCLNYYNKSYQIAIVIDPIGNDVGTFGWVDGTSTRLAQISASVYIGNDHRNLFRKPSNYDIIKCDKDGKINQ